MGMGESIGTYTIKIIIIHLDKVTLGLKGRCKGGVMDFRHFFQKGNLFYDNHCYEITEFEEFEDTSLVCDVTSIEHAFKENIGYMLILNVDFG